MKKLVVSILAIALLMSIACVSAFAVYGDITTRSMKAYADPGMTQYIGTIPEYTAVVVYDADSRIAAMNVNGVMCYGAASALTNSRFDYYYNGRSTLKAGATVYQRPIVGSRSVQTVHDHNVLVIGKRGDWVLIRTNYGGFYGFTLASNLMGFTPAE